jgi:2-(1,2-epoxy-1,2-dihydrophenyl)acetyl-CoA isomerase
MADTDTILSSLAEGVLCLTLNRPKTNAFNMEMITSLHEALRKAGRDASVRCIVLTGSGKNFSAGQDVRDFNQEGPISFRKHLQMTYNPLIMQLRQIEKPILAAINGSVAGAALGIALACDLRIAADNARFFVGFSGIGLAPDSSVSLMLPTLIGLGRAAELAFTNQPLDALQALEWGLINRVAPAESLQAEAMLWAGELAQGPVGAMGLTKRAFNQAVLFRLEQVLDYEAHIQEIAGQGAEHQEGVKAFLEKRRPKYVVED